MGMTLPEVAKAVRGITKQVQTNARGHRAWWTISYDPDAPEDASCVGEVHVIARDDSAVQQNFEVFRLGTGNHPLHLWSDMDRVLDMLRIALTRRDNAEVPDYDGLGVTPDYEKIKSVQGEIEAIVRAANQKQPVSGLDGVVDDGKKPPKVKPTAADQAAKDFDGTEFLLETFMELNPKKNVANFIFRLHLLSSTTDYELPDLPTKVKNESSNYVDWIATRIAFDRATRTDKELIAAEFARAEQELRRDLSAWII